MRESVNEKLDIKKVADNILQGILEGINGIACTSKQQEKYRKYLFALQDKFMENLSDKQKKEYNDLIDMQVDCGSSDRIFHILYGMKVQKVFNCLSDNPMEIIDYYESKGIPVEERYKLS